MRIIFAFFTALLLGASGARAAEPDFSQPRSGVACTTLDAIVGFLSAEPLKDIGSSFEANTTLASFNSEKGFDCRVFGDTFLEQPRLIGFYKDPKGRMVEVFSFYARAKQYYTFLPSTIPFA